MKTPLTRFSLSIILLLVFVCSTTNLFAQASTAKIKIPIVVSDNYGKSQLLWLGWHPGATLCTDETTMLDFGACDSVLEFESPPVPFPGNFDVRFIYYKTPFYPSCDPSNVGFTLDIHPTQTVTYKDTFKIALQAGGGFPFHFRWPANLSQFCDSMKLVYTGEEVVRINMLTQTTYDVTEISVKQVRIFTWGLKGAQPSPPAPSLVSPANGSSNQPASLTLSWGTVANAVLYHIEVATDSLFTSIVDTFYSTTGSKAVTGLPEGVRLYWRVRGMSDFITGCYSSTFNFITSISSGPALVQPLDAAADVGTNPYLRTRKMIGGTSYHFQLSRNSAFTDTIAVPLSADSLALVGPLENCRTYYWRARFSTAFATSPFSDSRSFTVATVLPSAPTINGPADSAINVNPTPTLSWSSNHLCTVDYFLQVSKDTAFSSTLVSQAVSATSFQLAPLEGEETFFWRVAARNSSGNAGAYTATRRFTTGVFPPPPPMQMMPQDNDVIPTDTVRLMWHRPPNKPTSYSVFVDTSSTFANPVWKSLDYTDTTILTSALQYCTKYFWKVNAKNSAGTSAFSTTLSFDIRRNIPGAPVLVFPANGDTGYTDDQELRWTGDACSQRYFIQVASDSLFQNILQQDTVTQLSKRITADNPKTVYYWKVNAVNELGGGPFASAYFTTASKTTPKVPALASPSTGSSGILRNPTLCWDSSRGADTYHLQVALDANFSVIVFNDSTVQTLCKQVGPLLYSKTYYWRVNAKNDVGTSAYTTAWSFSTLFPPDTVQLIHPPDSATGVSVQPELQWSIPDRADKYLLQLSRDPEFYNILYRDSSITTQSWQLFNLDGRSIYYWRVRAYNVAGNGPWSQVFQFKTTIVGVANWVIPLAVRETGFGQDSLYFGLHPNATYGINPPLGEFELPPPVVGQFEARFVDIPSRPGLLKEGLRVNLLPFTTYTQVDSFKFSFQLGTGEYPVYITWNSNFIRGICDSMVIMDMAGGLNLYERMDIVSSAKVTNLSTNSLLIVVYGALPVRTDVSESQRGFPEGFMLHQNYPNPFNPETRIDFSNEKPATIYLGVFDVLGREVAPLTRSDFNPGIHSVTWDGRNRQGSLVPSGIYYVRMIATARDEQADPFISMRKIIFMK